MKSNRKGKRFFACLLFVAALAGLAGVMLVIGRGHTVYMDNKALEWNGEAYSAPYKAVVVVRGEEVAKLYKRERGMSTWIGQNFRMTLKLTEEKGGEEIQREIAVKLPYGMDGVILNIPGLLAELPQEAWLSEFVIIPSAAEMEEEPAEGGDGFGELGGIDELGEPEAPGM